MKYLAMAVLALGAGIVVWMGSAFMVTNTLALLVIIAIALCYAAGIVELMRFQRDTVRLNSASHLLGDTALDLDQWLARLPVNCRNPVRQRIRGEAGALPGLVMTPHLTGLLVMLGLLGTFVGMVVTLQGAVSALENTAEVDAIRSAMSAPIKGLGLAFGTSVAGVSASAALGFVATLWRRERQRVARELDAQLGNTFRSHSLPAYREKVLDTLQHQAAAMPELVSRLTDHGQDLERFLQRIDQTLSAGQERFHAQMLTIHRELADSVGDSLRKSLAESGRLAGDSIRPVMEEAMADIVAASQETQHALRDGAREQLHAVVHHLESTSERLNGRWLEGLNQLVDGIQQLHVDVATAAERDQALLARQEGTLMRIDGLVTGLGERAESQQRHLNEQAQAFGDAAHTLATRLDEHGQTQAEQAARAQEALIQHLSDHYRELTRKVGDEFCATVASHSRQTLEQVEPLWREALTGLRQESATTQKMLAEHSERHTEILTASTQALRTVLDEQWSQALAEQRTAQADFLAGAGSSVTALYERFQVIQAQILGSLAALNENASEHKAREAALQRDQAALAGQLASLVDTMQSQLASQRDALTGFVANADALFEAANERAEQRLARGTARLTDAADAFAVGVAELTGLGDALAQWATAFENANGQLQTAADQLESAVLASAQRSDEQMGYYVAQAREVVDYSVQAQQALIEQMRQLARPV